MSSIVEFAYAKLNLSLDVVSKRDDGYHEMCMVMQSVSFCDELSMNLRNDGEISVSINLSYVPCDERNIAFKAAKVFFEALGEPDIGVDITIKKRIPVCAGLGGGSSDGAAVLRGLNRTTGKHFSQEQLEKLAEKLGSDVPFCIAGGTSLATGRGEIMESLAPFPDCVIVICKPRFSVSTPELFTRYDNYPSKLHPDTAGLRSSIEAGDLNGASRRLFNVFEDVLPFGRDHVTAIKNTLLEHGALGAAMTGTGSAVFGIFAHEALAVSAKGTLSKEYREVFLTMPKKKIII